ncbi:MAG: TPM domain-containing protein [Clostridiales bacterium]|nr:TPM domain-containing protein [Clostridiales bacterium]
MMIKIKKISVILITAILCLLFTATASADVDIDIYPTSDLLIDDYNLLTSSEFYSVEEELERISDLQKDFDVMVVIIDSLQGNDPKSLAKNIIDTHVEAENKKGGIVLLLAMEDRDYALHINGTGYDYITDEYGLDVVEKKVVPILEKDNFEKAFLKFATLSDKFVTEAKDGKAYSSTHRYIEFSDFTDNILIAVIVGAVAAIIITMPMVSKLKSVKPQKAAANYIKEDTFSITNQQDLFLFQNVTKTKIETSSSGGGGRSGGGGGGRSGKF